ncbi:transglutaminase domain-containing protein [Nonomuraea sp. NN258]|uniref:transglutaminase-like domain-containing protein n=1 Tax=Nonomuraea antri TaxID=2730852 RepID=UPI001567FCD4|nr:transglutaminase-like domain-containing protein [Nonomuraea antri]NRQ40484.1 transglutaminase domain-containing protein [Nonomuraea antri]
MTPDDLGFYATPGPMTTFAEPPHPPADVEEACRISRNLIVHEFLADRYGVGHAELDRRREEVESRSAAEMVAVVRRLGPHAFTEPRPPGGRMIGNCRHFTVFTVALLRAAGIPARARAGFAGYLGEGWSDHWVAERWDAASGRWLRTDAQLDDTQLKLFGLDLDPLDLPDGAFLSGAEAWQRCRSGQDDPRRFGLAELRGAWFVAGNVVRDLAALNKVELLPWDTWGMIDLTLGETEDRRTALVDEIAVAVVAGDVGRWRRLYERAEVRVPRTVRSHRYQREVHLTTV